MKVRYLAIVSSVAAFSLLAYLFAMCIKQFNTESTKEQINHSTQLCAVPTSSSVYLDTLKSKLSSVGSGTESAFATPLLLPQFKSVGLFEPSKVAVDVPRPLWLLHRSLLI